MPEPQASIDHENASGYNFLTLAFRHAGVCLTLLRKIWEEWMKEWKKERKKEWQKDKVLGFLLLDIYVKGWDIKNI